MSFKILRRQWKQRAVRSACHSGKFNEVKEDLHIRGVAHVLFQITEREREMQSMRMYALAYVPWRFLLMLEYPRTAMGGCPT